MQWDFLCLILCNKLFPFSLKLHVFFLVEENWIRSIHPSIWRLVCPLILLNGCEKRGITLIGTPQTSWTPFCDAGLPFDCMGCKHVLDIRSWISLNIYICKDSHIPYKPATGAVSAAVYVGGMDKSSSPQLKSNRKNLLSSANITSNNSSCLFDARDLCVCFWIVLSCMFDCVYLDVGVSVCVCLVLCVFTQSDNNGGL